MEKFFDLTTLFLFWFFLIINIFYILLIMISIPLIYRRFKEVQFEQIEDLIGSETLPKIGIILPFHNREDLAVNSIKNALNLGYPNMEVVAINDESSDRTFELVNETFALRKALPKENSQVKTAEVKGVYRSQLYPNLTVVDKVSIGSKSDAVNAGINESAADLIAVVDDDTILERDCLLRMIRPFYNKKSIAGQGGTLRILNGCEVRGGQITKIGIAHNMWAGIQVAEYLRAFLYGRLGWNVLGGPLIISGAFGIFRRSAVLEVGGFDPHSIGEDFELTARLQMQMRKKGHKDVIRFIPDPVAWTMAPDTLDSLKRQRVRWHQGLIEVLWKYRRMFFNPRYGKAGLIGYPYMLLGEFVEPILEVVGILLIFLGIALGYLSWFDFLMIILVTWGITTTLSCTSILLEVTTFRRYTTLKQTLMLIGYSVIENFIFRPMYLLWRFVGIYRSALNQKVW